MNDSITLKSLHLEYRVWIAELNFDINLIRIFSDRLLELAPAYKKEVSSFEQKLNSSREIIDEIRHRMHIEKMNLAAIVRDDTTFTYDENKIQATYKSISESFFKFRVLFNDLKSAFLRFESDKL